jgi:hypothetical protein
VKLIFRTGRRARRRVPGPPPAVLTPLQQALADLHASASPEVFLLAVEALLWKGSSRGSNLSLYMEAPVLIGTRMAGDVDYILERENSTPQDAAAWMLGEVLTGRYYNLEKKGSLGRTEDETLPDATGFEPHFPWLGREFQKFLDSPPPASKTSSGQVAQRRLKMPYHHPVRHAQAVRQPGGTWGPPLATDGTLLPQEVNLELLSIEDTIVDGETVCEVVIAGKKVVVAPGHEAVRLPDGRVVQVARQHLGPGLFTLEQIDSNYGIQRLVRALPRLILWAHWTQPDLMKLKAGQAIWRARRWKSPAEKRARLRDATW